MFPFCLELNAHSMSDLLVMMFGTISVVVSLITGLRWGG